MPQEPSKYAENQFDSATRNRFPLMSEILVDTRPRLAAAATANAAFTPALDALDSAIAAWEVGETAIANAEANLPARTFAFEDKLDSLTRKPDADTNSLLETWDTTIRGQVAYQGPTYMLLLPQGRETLTAGSYDARLDAGRDVGIRLSQQVTKPVLVTLGTTVTTFYNAARVLRTSQITAKGALDDARVQQEFLRKIAAAALINMVGVGLQVWKDTPALVDTLFSVALLRGGTQDVPAAPVDTLWTPAQRRLSTTVMPEGATRLEAWREGPGGMPEQLAIGEPGALEVIIPAIITFDAGDLYQLWLQSRNSRGTSAPGPKQNWTAV
jgi:hypothetical protein